jgi:hypothetical protein
VVKRTAMGNDCGSFFAMFCTSAKCSNSSQSWKPGTLKMQLQLVPYIVRLKRNNHDHGSREENGGQVHLLNGRGSQQFWQTPKQLLGTSGLDASESTINGSELVHCITGPTSKFTKFMTQNYDKSPRLNWVIRKVLRRGTEPWVWSFFEKLVIKSSLSHCVLELILNVVCNSLDLLFPLLKLERILTSEIGYAYGNQCPKAWINLCQASLTRSLCIGAYVESWVTYWTSSFHVSNLRRS